jgi:hypothetical protein
LKVGAGAGAGAEKNSFGSATLLKEIISLELDLQMGIQQEHSPWISKTCSIDMGMQNKHTAGKCGKDMQHGNTTCACSMLL